MCESGRVISTLGECYDLYKLGRDCYSILEGGRRRLYTSCSRGVYEGLNLCWKHSVSKRVLLMSEVKEKGEKIISEDYFPKKFHLMKSERKDSKEEILRLCISEGLRARVSSERRILEESIKKKVKEVSEVCNIKSECIQEEMTDIESLSKGLPDIESTEKDSSDVELSDKEDELLYKEDTLSDKEDSLSDKEDDSEDYDDDDKEDCEVIETKYGEELYLEVESMLVYRLDENGEGNLIGELLEVYDESKGICFYKGKNNVIVESFIYESKEYLRCVISGGIFEKKDGVLHYYGSSRKDKDGTLTIRKNKI